MRGDSLRDFYAKSLALVGLGMLGVVGAAVDNWPSAMTVPGTTALNLAPAGAMMHASTWAEIAMSRVEPTRTDVATYAAYRTVTEPALPSATIVDDGTPLPQFDSSLAEVPPPSDAISIQADAPLDVPGTDIDAEAYGPPVEMFRLTTIAPAPAPGPLQKIDEGFRTIGTGMKNGVAAVGGAFSAFGNKVKGLFGKL